MGLTKQYLRYCSSGVFNVIGGKSNVLFIKNDKTGKRLCAVGACENVILWDIRKCEKVATLYGDNHQVTMIRKSPVSNHLAVGYQNGSIRIFDLMSGDATITFNGHKSAVTALNYDEGGMRLVSGAMDTEIILWDIVNECGLFRLKGHKGLITQARFMSKKNILITSSKDTFVKFWDLDTQHCFKTLVVHRTEVWDFVLVHDTRLITGSVDAELRVFKLEEPDDIATPSKRLKSDNRDSGADDSDDDEADDSAHVLTCIKLGSLQRLGRGRVLGMSCDSNSRYLLCHGNGNLTDVFKIHSTIESMRIFERRQKKARKRARNDADAHSGDDTVVKGVDDEFKRLGDVRMSSKIRAIDVVSDRENSLQMIGLLNNNTVETKLVSCGGGGGDEKRRLDDSLVSCVNIPGHRTDVRALCFSSDNTAVMSASSESVKIWNRATMLCIRTMPCDYALCCLFAPGDRHVVVGTKSGKLQIYDIAAGILLETIDAHFGVVWSICLSADQKSIVSGSADKTVKFWEFELVTDEEYSTTTKRLTLVHARTLQLNEDVLCVKTSPDGRLVAVALLDSTVKIFFCDTLKFFLSLYGHKLPVLCMDISADSTLIVTGSADRNCKLWGLDFGDCHKSMFAHDDSIMCVSFVSRTHMFFTGGKDRLLKEWDGDSFQHIQTLKGHHGEIWALAVSPNGRFVTSASHDKSVRVWERSDEPLVLGEEQEMEREAQEEEAAEGGEQAVIAGEGGQDETARAGKKTIETVKAAERLMEALELHKQEQAKLKQHADDCKRSGKQLTAPPLHPMFTAFNVTTPDRYMLEVIKKVKSSELEESLLVLPFSYVTDLLCILNTFIEIGWEVELACRCLFFLLRVHQGQIASNQTLLPVIDQLRHSAHSRIHTVRDTFGFNLSALRMFKKQIDDSDAVKLFTDASQRFKQKRRRQKKRVVLTIKTV